MGKHKSTSGNWYSNYNAQSELSKSIFKDYATTSAKRRNMENVAIKRLAEDLYLRTLPKGLRKIARENSSEIENEIVDFLEDRYGRNNVVCDLISHPEERLPKQSITLGRNLFMAPENYRKGMPVWEYLKWFILRNTERSDDVAEAIEEWSGIPIHLQRTAYNQLLNIFRNRLQKEHDKEDEYGLTTNVRFIISFK
ncbi:hypothetical protein IKG33_02170 [Candidatus Saccharibacteria bacterium]|nr:hypothetical protein [Candidatus Saccharibacteria bacterium]